MTITRGPEEIRGVPTSIAAFLGETERGPLVPQLVTSLRHYRRSFGGAFAVDRYLPDAVAGFFANGGQRLYARSPCSAPSALTSPSKSNASGAFLERSISDGMGWVEFEPNDERLWARVRDTIRLFLRSQWQDGGLRGRTEDEAFFIKCDRTTMTQDDILNGRLVAEIGFAPLRPAEFIVLRFMWKSAESAVAGRCSC